MIHSMLTSRVLLDLRAQAGDNLDSSHVLTELKYNRSSTLSKDPA